MRATGAELAKNVALLAPKNVTLIDDSIVTERDKSFNLYTSDEDIGKHRSEVLSEKLQASCELTKISCAQRGSLTEDFIKQYDIFMVTDFFDRHTLEEWNLYCRRNRVGFVNANCIGTMLNIFVDFGSLKVFDRIYHGLDSSFYIENITNEAFGVVSVSKN